MSTVVSVQMAVLLRFSHFLNNSSFDQLAIFRVDIAQLIDEFGSKWTLLRIHLQVQIWVTIRGGGVWIISCLHHYIKLKIWLYNSDPK